MYKLVFGGALPLLLSACASASTVLPDVTSQQAVTSPTITSPASYQAPLEGFTYRAPTRPLDWRTVNEQQTEAN
jgi:hypothetical protein